IPAVRAAVPVGGDDVGVVAQERRVPTPTSGVPADARGPQRHAVEALPARDHLVLGLVAPLEVVLARQLDGALRRLRAAPEQHDLVQVARGDLGDRVAQLDDRRADELEAGNEGAPPRLSGHRLDDLFDAMADARPPADTASAVDVA